MKPRFDSLPRGTEHASHEFLDYLGVWNKLAAGIATFNLQLGQNTRVAGSFTIGSRLKKCRGELADSESPNQFRTSPQ